MVLVGMVPVLVHARKRTFFMVDYCPEVEKTFLIDVEVSCNEAAKVFCLTNSLTDTITRTMTGLQILFLLPRRDLYSPPIFGLM